MPLLPPQVAGPLSECSSHVRVQAQLTGSTVTLFADGAPVGGGVASWSDDVFPLNAGVSLAPGAKVTAKQALGGETSPASPQPVIVQKKPPVVGNVGCKTHIYQCGQCLWLDGMVPGATVQVTVGGAVRGSGRADDGTARIGLNQPTQLTDALIAQQTACGTPGLRTPLPPPDPVPLPREQRVLPAPALGAPLKECQRAVTVSNVLDGARVTLKRTSGPPETACFDRSSLWFPVPPLKLGETVTAMQEFPGCKITGVDSSAVTVISSKPVLPPFVVPPLCAGATTVRLTGLLPGSKVHIYQDSTNLGEAEAPDSTYDFPVPPLAPNTLIGATQELCGNWSHLDQCIKVKVDAHPGGLPAPHISPPLYECGAVVHVTNIHPSSTVSVWSTFLGAPIGVQTVYAASADIPVSPQLLKGDTIFAVEVGCGQTVQSAPPVPVKSVPKPEAPRIVGPVDDCMRTVTVTDVLPGARVDVYEDNTWAGSADAGASTVDVPILSGSLHAGGHVRACQHICQFKPVCGEPIPVNAGTCRDVVTHKNNNYRTGEYIYETILTPSLLKSGRFGWLVDRQVNGDIYAQPLYVRSVATTNHGTKNLVFVATSTNDVYAFDADNTNPDPAGLVWKWNNSNDPYRMLTSAEICQETRGSVGITSTPVIDPAANTMWFVTRRTFPAGTQPPPGQADGDNWLHAIDIRSGNELPHSPVKIVGHVDSPKHVDFDHTVQRNRPALLLNKGVIWVAFGTFSCDGGDYHGWVMAYKPADLSQLGTYCTSADGGAAGIWQSGHGLVGHDDGSVFLETGNETPPAALGDSFVKLRLGGPQGIVEAGHFTPDNARALRDGRDANGNFIVPPTHQYGTVGDTDLGSGGPVLLPGNRITGGGKQGRLYVMDAANMQLTQDTQKDALRILGQGFQHFHNTYLSHPPVPGQPIPVAWYAAGEMYGPNIHGAPIFWSGTNWIYHMPEKDYMQAYPYDPMSGTLGHVHAALSNVRPVDGMPGGFSSVSSNGAQDGIIWTLFPQIDGQWAKGPGDFVAFDATTLEVLWADHGTTYGFAKFCPPTIAGGKVFRPTFAALIPDGANSGGDNPTGYRPGALAIYGVLPKPHPWPPPHGWWPGLLRNLDRLPPIEQRHLTFGIWLGKPEGPAQNVGDARGGQFRRYSRQVRGVRNHSAAIELDATAGGPSCHNSKRGAVATVHSAIYWSEATGARFLQGSILEKWLTNGGPTGNLGYPIEDERPTENGQGRVATFENGTITWSPGKGCTVTHKK